MSPEQQQIAIAEACGWKHEADEYYEDRLAWFDPKTNSRGCASDLPDYLHDLNAMHEAEMVLTREQRRGDIGYLRHLWDICAGDDGGSTWDIAHATAAQRAEAFLKTKGLWTE